ncbi:MAG: hypothetical protein IKU52_02540 [Clostridia bacterium]|nr:hypothetical protein [Clostridia bacterium]
MKITRKIAINKKKLSYYVLYLLFFTVLAVIVSYGAITVKYKITDYTLANTPSNERLYCTYYNSLTYREQLLYDSITQAAENLKTESDIIKTSYTMEDLQYIISCIRADRSDLFYVCFDELVLYNSSHKTKVGMKYIDSKQNIKDMIKEFDAEINNALQLVNPSMTEFEKEVVLSDYITDKCTYTAISNDLLESTAYGALVKGEAVCDGYAYAAKELFNAAHIDTMVVFGTANESEHMWNMVNIDSDYYHLDLTWNDSDKVENDGVHFHGYFNLSDTEISLDHKINDPESILPKARKSNNYYKQTLCYAENSSQLDEIIYNSLRNALKENLPYIELEYPSGNGNAEIAESLNKMIRLINEEENEEVLSDSYRIMLANKNTNAITIQINYRKEVYHESDITEK